MTSTDADGLDSLLDRIEDVIGRLADPAAPLERLVTDYELATGLLDAAQARLAGAADRVAELMQPGTGRP